jgi:NADH-quinone oxidoreductase subunit B
MLLNAILTLHEQIQNSKLGVNRVAAARAAEEAALRATPTHEMTGLLAAGAGSASPNQLPISPVGHTHDAGHTHGHSHTHGGAA